MRLDDLYLVDIIEANEAIISMMDGASFTKFEIDATLVAAVQMQLIIMGEALTIMKAETRGNLDVPAVQRMRSMRNRIVHGYFDLDKANVYGVAKRHAPKLASAAEDLLAEIFPETYQRLVERRHQGTIN